MKKAMNIAVVICAVLLVLVFVGGLIYLDFAAFREKFPDAAWWSWLFSHR